MNSSSNTESMLFGSSSLTESKLEEDSSFSDREETMSVAEREDGFTDVDYWFGCVYFRYLLAQEAFGRFTPGCTTINIDALIQHQETRYPYRDVLQALQKIVSDCYDSCAYAGQGKYRTALMISIGHTMRSESEEAKEKMRVLLHAYLAQERALRSSVQPSATSNSARDTSFSSSSRASDTSFATELMPLPVQMVDSELWKYTSELKEKGDSIGFVPKYNFQRTSQAPPTFKAVVSFQDYVFEGSGRTKQQAKHAASKAACKALGLEIM